MSRLVKGFTLFLGAVSVVSVFTILSMNSIAPCGQLVLRHADTDVSREGVPLHFKDKYFEPIFSSFEEASRKFYRDIPEKRFRNGSIPKAVVYVDMKTMRDKWLYPHIEDIEDRMCPYSCNLTTDLKELSSADAVVIHLWSVRSREELLERLGRRDPSQPWVMLESETHLRANKATRLDYRTLDGVFNRTFHFRRDSDVLMVHGFVVRRGRDASLLPPHWVRQPELAVANISRHIAVAFISDCSAFSGRLQYIDEMKKFIRVDVYGKCGNLKCGATHIARDRYRADTDKCMRMAAQKYLFYLAFENALCKDYVTEKLYNHMYYPMVPVVLGAADYAAILPPHSYIDANKYSPADLALKLQFLADNPQEYQSYLAWKKYYQPSTVGGYKVFCDLCKRLHEEDFYEQKTIHDFYDWFVTKSHCDQNGYVP